MSKALLVDTNRAAYTIYQALLAAGHEVWVVGSNPREPLAQICPNYVQMDYSDIRALDQFVALESFDLLIPGCTDVSYSACAEISRGRYLGIDTPESTRALNDKAEYRKLARALGIPVPQVIDPDGTSELADVIVKPVDSFSGRGISILRKPSRGQLLAAYQEACAASKTGTALIEEFVTGQLYSHSAFLAGGRLIADFIVREDCVTNSFTVDTSRVEFDFDQELIERLRGDALRILHHLRLSDGLIHTQFIMRNDGYWAIELTRRCPGDLYALLIEMSTGYPYGASYLASFLGKQPAPRSAGHSIHRIIRHTATSKKGESLWGFAFKRPVDLRLFVPLAEAGDFIKPSPYGRAAVIFFGAESESQQESLYRDLLAHNLYSYTLEPT